MVVLKMARPPLSRQSNKRKMKIATAADAGFL
jgi:hypothetical protein